jgi:uncharacterized membrane protein (UPF0127 family)
MLKRGIVLVAILTLVMMAASWVLRPPPLGRAELIVGQHKIIVELAATDESRALGLMYRKTLARDGGMLFMFETVAKQCMWMKDTLLPLSVAFIGADGEVLNIENMVPGTLSSHCSVDKKDAGYALETNQGWFQEKKIVPGMMVSGLPR